jgi:hypothetical protein
MPVNKVGPISRKGIGLRRRILSVIFRSIYGANDHVQGAFIETKVIYKGKGKVFPSTGLGGP